MISTSERWAPTEQKLLSAHLVFGEDLPNHEAIICAELVAPILISSINV